MTNEDTRRVILPAIKDFKDLFPIWNRCKAMAPPTYVVEGPDYAAQVLQHKKNARAKMYIESYCHLHMEDYRDSIWVGAHRAIYKTVANNTILVAGDRMSFEIIQWNDRQALVLCKHGRILGDVWLAIIDPKTIPHVEGGITP